MTDVSSFKSAWGAAAMPMTLAVTGEGARWLIDRIKADAAIWKKEIFAGGERWVGVDG